MIRLSMTKYVRKFQSLSRSESKMVLHMTKYLHKLNSLSRLKNKHLFRVTTACKAEYPAVADIQPFIRQ